MIISDPRPRPLPAPHPRPAQAAHRAGRDGHRPLLDGPDALPGRHRRPLRLREVRGRRPPRPHARRPHGARVAAPLVGEGGAGRRSSPRRPAPASAFAWGGQASATRAFTCAMKPSLHARLHGPLGRRPGHARGRGLGPAVLALPQLERPVHLHAGLRAGPGLLDQLLDVAGGAQGDATRAARPARHLLIGWMPSTASPARRRSTATVRTAATCSRPARTDRLNDSWRGHVVGEWLAPGDFYAHDDGGWFFRAEVIYGFKRAFGLTAL